jgi:methylthioribulose-1-phosphate dehydratase
MYRLDRPISLAGVTSRTSMSLSLGAAARAFGDIGRDFYTRGWVLGTSGNFSAVLRRQPLRLAMTSSGISKGHNTSGDILEVGADGTAIGRPKGRPSAEALLHAAVVTARGAGAVLHTHSVWSTMLSELYAVDGRVELHGFEMLKGLDGVRTHAHTERIPILDNDQDMERLAREVSRTLAEHPDAHAFLLRRHGLYTWGSDLAAARRHVEVLEFLFETTARLRSADARPGEKSWR